MKNKPSAVYNNNWSDGVIFEIFNIWNPQTISGSVRKLNCNERSNFKMEEEGEDIKCCANSWQKQTRKIKTEQMIVGICARLIERGRRREEEATQIELERRKFLQEVRKKKDHHRWRWNPEGKEVCNIGSVFFDAGLRRLWNICGWNYGVLKPPEKFESSSCLIQEWRHLLNG